MTNQQNTLPQNPSNPTTSGQIPSQTFYPLHACNAANPQTQNAHFLQLAALYRDLYNRLLLLQLQALPNVMQQSPSGAQTPSHNTIGSNALAEAQQSPQDACFPLSAQPQPSAGIAGAKNVDLLQGNAFQPAIGENSGLTRGGNVPTSGTIETQNKTYDVPFAQVFAQLEAETPGYFAQNPVRAELKDYICQNCAHLHDDEIIKILHLAKNLENQAVESFKLTQTTALTNLEKQKLIQDANRAAISKLATNSASAKPQGTGSTRIFTRAQIGAMSQPEFKKHQAEIFAQYAKGLIK